MGNITGTLLAKGWKSFNSTAFNKYLQENKMLPSEFEGSVSAQRVREDYENPEIFSSVFGKDSKILQLLKNLGELEHFKGDSYYHVNGQLSPDGGILFIKQLVRENWAYNCYFILTGFVEYDHNLATDKVKVDKKLKREELTIRRACAWSGVRVPASAYNAEIIDGNKVVLASSGTFDVNKYQTRKEFNLTMPGFKTLKELIRRWPRYGEGVDAPDWYKEKCQKGFIHFQRAYGQTKSYIDRQVVVPGLVMWCDFVPETGKFTSYIWMTGDITYDSKTGEPLYNNVTKTDYREFDNGF